VVSKTLILGVGNTMRHDDGVGVEVIKLLQQEQLPNIDLQDGGTDGLGLIDIIKQYHKAIIIDAVNMQMSPGSIKSFDSQEAKIKIKNDALSTHGFGLAEVLRLLEQLGCDTQIKIIGVQPQDISFGEGLTEVVAAKLPYIVKLVKNRLL